MATQAQQDVKISGDGTIPRILVADDQSDVLEALRLLLKRHGYEIKTTTSPAGLLEALDSSSFDLLLMDLNYARDTTSGREGIDLLTHLKARTDTPPIVVMTGWGSVGLAVEAMQRGVGDFVEKPWENERLLEILREQLELGRARRKAQRKSDERELRNHEIALQLRKHEREIEDARRIQEGLLPKIIPQIRGYEIACAWKPARVVGGDYFDVLKFNENSIGLCIADVAGKGVPAALLMSNLQATVRSLAKAELSPAELCFKADRSIGRNIAPDRFVTFFYGVLDAAARRFVYANAGHNAPIHLRRDGTPQRLREGGTVLGVFSDANYEQGIVDVAPGDRLVLFTDGVTETENAIGQEFGEGRLLELLIQSRTLAAEPLQRRILDAVAEFTDGEFADDATLIVVAVK